MDIERRKRLEEFCRQWDKRIERKIKEGLTPPKKEIFERMTWELSRVPFEEVFVDVGCKQKMIDFNVLTGVEKFSFSCAIYEEVWDDEHDVCFTSVERDGQMISYNVIDLTEFVDKVLEVIDDLNKLREEYGKEDNDNR